MARIAGVPPKKANLEARAVYWMAKRRLGKVPEPITVTAHHPWILRGCGAFELALERCRRVEAKLKALASIKVATLIGCPF